MPAMTYYDVEGVGYVYDEDTQQPVENAVVIVASSFRSNGYATVQPIKEHYSTNKDGYFGIKFLKRTNRRMEKFLCFQIKFLSLQ
jgi:hypothetical protein